MRFGPRCSIGTSGSCARNGASRVSNDLDDKSRRSASLHCSNSLTWSAAILRDGSLKKKQPCDRSQIRRSLLLFLRLRCRHPRQLRQNDRHERSSVTVDLDDDRKLLCKLIAQGGRKYTAGNIDRQKYERLVELGWLMATSPNISDVLYEVTDKGRQDAS